MSRQAFDARFSDEEACSLYLAERRWPEGFVCPCCGTCGLASQAQAHDLGMCQLWAADIRDGWHGDA
jgi:hypothetical protein